jgi:hypothetical protein
VYVIGAGFSHGCGYPLTSKLLPGAWSRLAGSDRADLESIIRFHYPRFDPHTEDTFPNIEQLITQIAVNIDLFDGSRRHIGKLRKRMLVAAREALFREIFDWFHTLYPAASSTPWLQEFVERIKREQAAVICINWDLLLDQALWGNTLSASGYGLTTTLARKGPHPEAARLAELVRRKAAAYGARLESATVVQGSRWIGRDRCLFASAAHQIEGGSTVSAVDSYANLHQGFRPSDLSADLETCD